jgi:hypothetical protein
MAAGFMESGYQAEFRFAIEQTGVVRILERSIFPAESEADGDGRFRDGRTAAPPAGFDFVFRATTDGLHWRSTANKSVLDEKMATFSQ